LRFLVTGAAGFIGSHLSARLSILGHQVLGIDNFDPYYSPSLKHLRVRELLTPLEVNVELIDLTNLDLTRELIKDFNPETVIHLAAQPGVRTPISQSYKYIQNNLVAFTNVLQSSIEEAVPNFLYASSSSVYGNAGTKTYSEGDSSIRPLSIYGATKFANEILAPTYAMGTQTKTRGLRFFTVYGPWGRPDMAYFRLINSVLGGSKFNKFGDGEIKRDFTYVDDITVAIVKLSEELSKREGGFSDVVNIGGGNPHSLNELINLISRETEIDSFVEQKGQNLNDINFTCADIAKLRMLTDCVPSVDLKDGVRMTFNWAAEPGVVELLDSWVESSI